MSKIQLILLGHFECLLSSGQRISLSMRKAEVLLAYLALAPGIRHPRERLINLLWSDRGEEQARNSLRQCLSAIRKSLGEAADLVLQVDRSTVSLNANLVDVDVHEFERLATEGDFESLKTAADLYQGEFLEGISIRDAASQEWLDNERSRFKRQFIEILLNLAETELVSHDFGNAIKSAERLVKQDPLGEAGWRLLMRSYFENGDRSHALQAFKRCQKALRDELDVDPEAATIELRDQFAAGASKPAQVSTSTNGESFFDTAATTGYHNGESSLAPQLSTDHSIAVLPFDNLSGDPEQEYFSDGITESIILNLSRFPGLHVKSRNSSFAFKQQIKSPGEISRELEVDYIVEGSIRKSQEQIRITVQLIEAASGNQVWGKRYDAGIDNLFDLEEDLSRTIAATVTGQIESDLQRTALAKGAAHQQSYDLLLCGAYHVQRFNRQDNLIAIEKLNQCLAQDPDNVRAHVNLYGCYSMSYLERWVEDYQSSFELAAEHIRAALALDPDSGFVQAFYAEYLIFCGELDLAELQLNKAIATNPNHPDALATMTLVLNLRGEFEAALELARKTYSLDPYHPWIEWEMATAQYFCGRFQEVLQTIENSRTLPGFTRMFCVTANIKLDRLEAAQQAFQTFLQECRQSMFSMPENLDDWYRYIRDNYPFRDESLIQDIVDCLLAAGLEDEIEPRHRSIENETHSIAVLPFDNLSGDPAQEYFSDGITESIILNLSLFPGLNVKSRNSSFAFKQQIKSPGEISRELEVDYIVEGSIRKTDERVRVTVQLVDATSGNQVWGKRYDAEIENLFDLEEELSRTIATTVTGQIESDLQRIAIAKGAAHQQSYDLLLQGIYHCKKSNAADMVIAIEKLHQCLELDSSNALAHATLYACHEMNWIDRWVPDFEASRKLCKVHASKALELNPELGSVQVAFAENLIFNRKYDEAETHLNRALEINPNDSEAIAALALNLSSQGKSEAALKQARLALQLDPYHTWARWILADSQFFCGLYEDVLGTIADTGNAPGFIQLYKTAANVRLGRMDVANNTLKSFLQHCRESMSSMPRTIDEWLAYSRDNAPFADPALNQEIIDDLLQAGLEEEMAAAQESADPGALPSIAVLPFENMSGDPEQEYFSDGITAGIILSLGMFKGLLVKSQRSSFAFKNSVQSSSEIGEALGVDYLVEGSIRKSDTRVRISAQLVEAADGNQIWGRQYNAEAEDVLNLEQELGQTIAATVEGRVGHTLQLSALRKPARDLKSYDLYLRALYHFGKFTPQDLATAIEQFERCIEIDPDNAEAHMQLGMTHEIIGYENWTDDREKSAKLSEHHLRKAVELAPDNAWVHAYLSERLLYTHDLNQAEYHADKAIELNPNLPEAYAAKAQVTMLSRRYDEALECARLCVQLDPYNSGAAWAAGEAYLVCGKYKQSVKTFRSIETPPNVVRAQIAAGLAGMGQMELAHKEMQLFLENAHKNMPDYPSSIEAWRQFWREYLPFKFEEDSENYIDLLLGAGLCDDMAETGDDMPSIAVLPFENMSGDPEQEHFADGITTDIIATLSKFKHMRTVARYSILQYRDQKTSIADIAEQQKVRYILEGSVRKSGEHIRVSAQLIDAQNDQVCWSERFDRDLDALFAVQDEITQSIALAMKVQFDDGEMALHRSKGATSIRAWELTLAAVDLQDTYIRQNILDARTMTNEAILLDPDYAYAWITLGWSYWQEAYSGWSDSIEELIEEAVKANQHAMSLDPNYGEAWIQAGMNHQMKHEPEEAIAACLRAVELEPGSAEVHALTAFAYLAKGDPEEARKYEQNMRNLCPILPNWYYLVSGGIEKISGNLDLAIELFQLGLDVEPDAPLCQFYLIDALMEKGDEVRARQLAEEIRALDKSVTGKGLVHSSSYDARERQRFHDNLAKFNLV